MATQYRVTAVFHDDPLVRIDGLIRADDRSDVFDYLYDRYPSLIEDSPRNLQVNEINQSDQYEEFCNVFGVANPPSFEDYLLNMEQCHGFQAANGGLESPAVRCSIDRTSRIHHCPATTLGRRFQVSSSTFPQCWIIADC
jgi:hypothetical protein